VLDIAGHFHSSLIWRQQEVSSAQFAELVLRVLHWIDLQIPKHFSIIVAPLCHAFNHVSFFFLVEREPTASTRSVRVGHIKQLNHGGCRSARAISTERFLECDRPPYASLGFAGFGLVRVRHETESRQIRGRRLARIPMRLEQ
jgi:hypothetical protein